MAQAKVAGKSYNELKNELGTIKKRANLELKIWKKYDTECNKKNYTRTTATKKHGK